MKTVKGGLAGALDRPDPEIRFYLFHGPDEAGSRGLAERLLKGAEAPAFASVPFVWSDQYDCKIQAVGRPRPDDDVAIVHGTLEERRFVALHGRKGRLVGAVAINRVRQLMAVRRAIREGAAFEDAVREAGGS